MRPSKRKPEELRPVTLERGVSLYAEGSCLIKFGNTHVAVRGQPGGQGAGLDERPGAGLGYGGIRHAAALDVGADAPRGLARAAIGPDTRNSTADWAVPCAPWSISRRWASGKSRSIATSSKPMAAPARRLSPAPGWRFGTAFPGWSRATWWRKRWCAIRWRPSHAVSTRASRSSILIMRRTSAAQADVNFVMDGEGRHRRNSGHR